MTSDERRTIDALRRELEADLPIWEGFLERLPDDDPMHALLGLRVASIRSTLASTAHETAHDAPERPS